MLRVLLHPKFRNQHFSVIPEISSTLLPVDNIYHRFIGYNDKDVLNSANFNFVENQIMEACTVLCIIDFDTVMVESGVTR